MMNVVLPKLKRIQKSFFCIAIMLAFLPNIVFSQVKTITGKVTDAGGLPLANVTVLVKGTTNGTATSNDGSFSINVSPDAKQLEFTALGFDAQTFTISGRNKISVALVATGSKTMEEVVVTGIVRVKKSQFIGASSKISEKALVNKPVGSFDQLLQGAAPGLLALTGSGQPGNPTGIIIRGQNSIAGGTDPLYIIDGIPVETGVFQGFNPNDFASIEVLRDAATQALYGSRGSGGIIVITTKRGTPGRFKLSYSFQAGVKDKPEFSYQPMNTTQLLKAQHDYGQIVQGAANASELIPGWYYSSDNPRYTALSVDGQKEADHLLDSISQINTNWYDQFFRRGSFTNNELNFSGGTGKARFYSSLGYYKEQGIIKPSDMKRITLRNNIDFSDDKFTFGITSNIGYTKRNFDPGYPGFIANFNSFLIPSVQVPYAKLNNPDGTLATGGPGDINASKYVAAQFLDIKSKDKNYNDQAKLTFGVNLAYKISDHLTASVSTSADFRETQSSIYESREAFIRKAENGQTNPRTLAGSQTETLTRFLTTDIRPGLVFTKTLKEKHDLEVSVYGEYIQENLKAIGFKGYGIDPRTPNTSGVVVPGNAGNQLYSSIPAANNGKSENVLESGFATLRYTYAGKYTFSGSYRKDGSSKLPIDNRWVGFYSMGALWDITKENFAKNSRFVNVLRIRASYGGSGNANNFPSDYYYQSTYGTGSYSGLTTQLVATPGNPNAKWETTYTLNIGTDFELWKRRIYGDINVYNKMTKDLYVDRQVAAEHGGFTIPVNAGKLQNRGIEWNINADVIRNKNLTITLFANGAYNKNKLVSIGGETPYQSGTSFLEVGLPLGSHYAVKWAGVDAGTGQPLYYTKDGKLTLDPTDLVTDFGTWEAPWKGGFGTNIHFKCIDISVMFSWQRGANKVDNLQFFAENPAGFLSGGFNQSTDLNFWKKPGDIASTPSPNYTVGSSISNNIHDASFLRLRDVNISYTFPKSLLDGWKFISSAKFYIQCSNLYIWTRWKGMDPEAGAVNINLGEYPNPRSITAGLNLTF